MCTFAKQTYDEVFISASVKISSTNLPYDPIEIGYVKKFSFTISVTALNFQHGDSPKSRFDLKSAHQIKS